MAEIPNITELDVAAWLRKARKQPDTQAYLEGLNEQATDAIAAGDEYVTALSQEGGNSQQQREISARFLQHVTELCLQRLSAEQAAGGVDKLPPAGAVRIGDFS